MKQLTHIGTIELVSFPDYKIVDVPAKIDTGADSSAIWASNVHLKGDKLVFNYFAPGSTYYKAKPETTTTFKVTSIKNSFGQEEYRYKIRLSVQIGDKTLTRWFSLANRSQNTYPILLGKNFLKNKFVVDVAHKFMVSNPNINNEVLILSTKPSAEFFQEVSKYNQEPVQYMPTDYNKLLYYLDGDTTQVLNLHDNKTDIAKYAFTYFKSHAKYSELATAAAEYLEFKARPFADREIINYVSNSKLSQYMKLNCYNLPVPPSICASNAVLKTMYQDIQQKLGTPFVLKETASDKGKNNYLIDNQKDFTTILSVAPKGYLFLVQKYIPNDGFMRVYVLDKEAQLAIWRKTHNHADRLKKHLNKPAGGLNARLVNKNKLTPEVRNLAVRAAGTLDRQVSGIDLVQDKTTKKWYILEVNNAPQIKSGAFMDEKAEIIAHFFDKELRQ